AYGAASLPDGARIADHCRAARNRRLEGNQGQRRPRQDSGGDDDRAVRLRAGDDRSRAPLFTQGRLIYTFTPSFSYQGRADWTAAFTALMFLTPSLASHSSSAFKPCLA